MKRGNETASLPDDLIARVDQDFIDPDVRQEVKVSLEELWSKALNVGAEQLARAIVFLAEGDLEEFQTLSRTFCGDPRDLLVKANRRQQNVDYWFSTPFSEMGPVKPKDE